MRASIVFPERPNRGGTREETVRARRCLYRDRPSAGWICAGAAIVQDHHQGYEIKNVTFARGESTENRDIFVVTLQKDKSVAVCYFAAANWINLSPAALEDSKRCDVR